MKITVNKMYAIVVVAVLAVSTFLIATSPSAEVVPTPTETVVQVERFDYSVLLTQSPRFTTIRFGDCMADGAKSGDLYETGNPWCVVFTNTPAPIVLVAKSANEKKEVIPAPTLLATQKPDITPTVTQTPEPTDTPVVTSTPNPNEPTQEPTKAKCNKGEGNGGEDCDPGNNPDKGNDDED